MDKKVEMFTVSSLSKVFPLEKATLYENENTALKNETFSFEIVIENKEQRFMNAQIKAVGETASCVEIREIGLAPAYTTKYNDADDYIIDKEATLFPDILYPLGIIGLTLRSNMSVACFITVKNLPVGKNRLEFELHSEDGELLDTCSYCLEVIDKLLPDQQINFSNWFHYDCIAQYYNKDVFSTEYYQILGNYFDNMVAHGINILYTPLFTPALDTQIGGERLTAQLLKIEKNGNNYSFDFSDVKYFIEFAKSHGFKKFEFSHLFTQWGAEFCPKIFATERGELKRIFGWDTLSTSEQYQEFMSQFLPELNIFIEKMGLIGNCYCHVSDEPSMGCIDRYEQLANVVKKYLPNAILIDALSHYDFYEKKLLDIPVVATSSATPFLDNVENFWVYYCCGQYKNSLSNRFFNFPSERNRIIGAQLYLNKAKGLLQWGYNFYNSSFSKKPINPYVVTDAYGAFEAGDCFVVYPGENAPIDSIRHEVFHDAIQDYLALTLLESMYSRAFCEKLLDDFGVKKGFETYIHDPQNLINLRKKINDYIKISK